jgi:two-component system chemotaxis response regulator CheY
MKFLVVDDEPVSRKKMERIVKEVGECVAVAGGAEALDAFTDAWNHWSPFGIITLDVSMPDMDGTETLLRLRDLETANKVPVENRAKVIMVTARADMSTVVTAIQAGCDDYIVKPFDRDTVNEKLAKFGVR